VCLGTLHISFGRCRRAAQQDHARRRHEGAGAGQLDLFNQWLAGKTFVLGDRFSVGRRLHHRLLLWSKHFGVDRRRASQEVGAALLEAQALQRALATQSSRSPV